MIKEKLEILLITYNRYKDLDNTLKQFYDGPFSECKFTILDNCSNDKTPEICVKYHNLFSDMHIIRHEKNIGASANFLRAVETSKSIYTWVICDDDNYDFSDCSDIINVIDSEKYDLISPGSQGEQKWERGLSTSVKKLIEKGSFYFIARSFIPGIIFKTELFDSKCMVEGYLNAHNLFPHFPFVNKSLENNFSIYLSQKDIIHRGNHNTASFPSVYFLAGWINSCSLIKDRNIRKKAVYSLSEWFNGISMRDIDDVETPWGFRARSLIIRIFAVITWDKMMREKEFSKNILYLIYSIMSTFGFNKEMFLILLILPVSIMPRFLLQLFLQLYIYLKYNIKGKNMPSEWNILFSDKKNIDPMRRF